MYYGFQFSLSMVFLSVQTSGPLRIFVPFLGLFLLVVLSYSDVSFCFYFVTWKPVCFLMRDRKKWIQMGWVVGRN